MDDKQERPRKPTDHDPNWSVIPALSTVIAMLAGSPVWLSVIMGLYAFDFCSSNPAACSEEIAWWYASAAAAAGALVCVVLTWTWPKQYRYRWVRGGFALLAAFLAVMAIVGMVSE